MTQTLLSTLTTTGVGGAAPRAPGPPSTDEAVLVLRAGEGHHLDGSTTLVLEDGTRREIGSTVRSAWSTTGTASPLRRAA